MSSFDFFKNKKVLITGHTGFKGSWLALWLDILGAEVFGISVDIPTNPSNYSATNLSKRINDYRLDIRDSKGLEKLIHKIKPDVIFHLAAQALVRPSYDSPLSTIEINALGTASLLNSLLTLNEPVISVMITSDKVYDNVEWLWGYRETDRLGGKDPYSASKGMAELVIRTYAESFFNKKDSKVSIGIARAGNVIGGGDWALDRIVPDCMRAWSKNKIVDIRNPMATRPWQHVLEPLSGYLLLAFELSMNSRLHNEAFNFGPSSNQNYSVKELINEMSQHWNYIHWNDISKDNKHLHEAGLLKLNCDKALNDLNWQPTLKFKETVRITVEWYKEYYQNFMKFSDYSMHDFATSQIAEYVDLANKRNISWTGKVE